MIRLLVFTITLLLSTGVIGQESGNDSDTTKPALAPAQPPPDMEAPGMAAFGTTSAASAPVNVPQRAQVAADKSNTGPVAGGMPELPVITVRKEGNDTVEEYRRNGKIFMVRIMPKDGPAHYYVDRTGNGRLDRDPLDNTPGPISPVYFKIYDWK